MPRVLKKSVPSQTLRASARPQLTIPLDDGTTMLALIQALIPLGLIAVGADEMIAQGRIAQHVLPLMPLAPLHRHVVAQDLAHRSAARSPFASASATSNPRGVVNTRALDDPDVRKLSLPEELDVLWSRLRVTERYPFNSSCTPTATPHER